LRTIENKSPIDRQLLFKYYEIIIVAEYHVDTASECHVVAKFLQKITEDETDSPRRQAGAGRRVANAGEI